MNTKKERQEFFLLSLFFNINSLIKSCVKHILMWLSHSLVEFGRVRGCPFRKVERPSRLSSNTSLEVTSENTNAQPCCAYGIFLQWFKSLMAFSHPYFWSYHLFFQGISLTDPSSHPSQTCSLTKVNSASEIFGNPFQGLPHISSSVSLFVVSSHQSYLWGSTRSHLSWSSGWSPL